MHRVPESHLATCSYGFLVWDVGRDPCGFVDLSQIDKECPYNNIAESASYLPIGIVVVAENIVEYSG